MAPRLPSLTGYAPDWLMNTPTRTVSAAEMLNSMEEFRHKLSRQDNQHLDRVGAEINTHAEAVKHSKGKVRIDLFPVPAIVAGARAFTTGVEKYGAHNWSNGKGIDTQDLYRASLNHLLEYGAGKTSDAETGLCPLDHAIAALAMLIATKENKLNQCRPLKEMHHG